MKFIISLHVFSPMISAQRTHNKPTFNLRNDSFIYQTFVQYVVLIEFSKYRGLAILNYFLENPTTEIHIKELSRQLNVSSATSKHFCDLLNKNNVLLSEKKGNAIFFRLNNTDLYVVEMKKFYAITLLKSALYMGSIEGIFNVVVYGSYSSGLYTETSDIDLLVISRSKIFDDSFIAEFQKILKREVNVTKLTLAKFSELRDDNDSFILEILKNNFPLYGGILK